MATERKCFSFSNNFPSLFFTYHILTVEVVLKTDMFVISRELLSVPFSSWTCGSVHVIVITLVHGELPSLRQVDFRGLFNITLTLKLDKNSPWYLVSGDCKWFPLSNLFVTPSTSFPPLIDDIKNTKYFQICSLTNQHQVNVNNC